MCGELYDVLDVDPRNGGDETLDDLAAGDLIPNVHWIIETPSGGWHLYVDRLGVEGDCKLPGLDLQDARRMVLVPPTPGYRVLPRAEWPDLGAQPADAARRLHSVLQATPLPTPAPAPDPGTALTPQELAKARAVLAKLVREVQAGGTLGRNNVVTHALGPAV